MSRALEINPHVSLIKRHISHLPHVSAAGRARKSRAEPQSQGEPERAKACKAHGDTKTEARRDRKRALVKSEGEREGALVAPVSTSAVLSQSLMINQQVRVGGWTPPNPKDKGESVATRKRKEPLSLL